MPDDEKAASSTADVFYKPEAESAPAEEKEPAVTSESATDKPKSEAEQAETASGSEPEKDKEPKGHKAEGRIRELIARNKELERQLAQEKEARAPKPAEKLTEPQPPDPNKFETLEALRAADAEYYKKQAAYEVQQAIEKDRKERATEAEQAKIRELNANIEKIWMRRETATEKRHPDYKDTVYGEDGKIRIQVNSAADGFILDSDIGPELLYHLAKHPDDAERLTDLNPYQTVRELTKLEDKLSEKLKVPKKVTSAPAPPDDVGGRGSVSNQPRPLEEIFYGKT